MLNNEVIFPTFNHTLIALIPKISYSISAYKPFKVLYIYILVLKVLPNIFKKARREVTSEYQIAFVAQWLV